MHDAQDTAPAGPGSCLPAPGLEAAPAGIFFSSTAWTMLRITHSGEASLGVRPGTTETSDGFRIPPSARVRSNMLQELPGSSDRSFERPSLMEGRRSKWEENPDLLR